MGALRVVGLVLARVVLRLAMLAAGAAAGGYLGSRLDPPIRLISTRLAGSSAVQPAVSPPDGDLRGPDFRWARPTDANLG